MTQKIVLNHSILDTNVQTEGIIFNSHMNQIWGEMESITVDWQQPGADNAHWLPV